MGQGETLQPQGKDTRKSLREKESSLRGDRTMGILPPNNIADINHHPTLSLPGLDLEPEIYYLPRFVLCVMETDQKQDRLVQGEGSFHSFQSGLPSGEQQPQKIISTPIPNDDGAQGSQPWHWGESRTQALSFPSTSMTL